MNQIAEPLNLHFSPPVYCGRRSIYVQDVRYAGYAGAITGRCDGPYSLRPVRRSVGYACTVLQSVAGRHSGASASSLRQAVRNAG